MLQRAAAIAVLLAATPSRADNQDVGSRPELLGLSFGMSADEVKAAKPCTRLRADREISWLFHCATTFAGRKAAVELQVPAYGLGVIALEFELGPKRARAVASARALLSELRRYEGLQAWGKPVDVEQLFAGLDSTDARFGQQFNAGVFASAVDANKQIDMTIRIIYDRRGYSLRTSFWRHQEYKPILTTDQPSP